MLTHCPRNSGSKLWGLMPIQSMTMWSHCLPDPVAHGHSPRVISCSGFLVLVAHCNLQENSSSPVSLPTYVCCMSVCAHVCMRKSAIYARCLPQSLFTLLLKQGLLLSLQIQLDWLAASAGIHLSLSPCRGVASTSHCA